MDGKLAEIRNAFRILIGHSILEFVEHFLKELKTQVELGQAATDYDYIRFQRTVNANVKAGPRIRQEILLRKAFM